ARNLPADTISNIAKVMYERGLCYLCAWGPDCERVHDIFDEMALWMNISAMKMGHAVTTWHVDEPIEDAVCFFIFCAIPDEQSGLKNACDADWIAVSVATTIGCKRSRLHCVILKSDCQKTQKAPSFLMGPFRFNAATTYSPTHFRVQYNRPCGA